MFLYLTQFVQLKTMEIYAPGFSLASLIITVYNKKRMEKLECKKPNKQRKSRAPLQAGKRVVNTCL